MIGQAGYVEGIFKQNDLICFIENILFSFQKFEEKIPNEGSVKVHTFKSSTVNPENKQGQEGTVTGGIVTFKGE